jgi:hypothetical protein
MAGTRIRRFATIGGVSAAMVLAGGVALAAVSGTPAANAIGSGGYNSTTADPHGFTDLQGVVSPDQYAQTVAGGAHGTSLCDHATGLAAQIGEVNNNLDTVFSVVSVLGNPPGGCPGTGPAPSAVGFPDLSAVPFGHHVWVNTQVIKVKKVKKILICFDPKREHPAPTQTLDPDTHSMDSTGPSYRHDHLKCFKAFIVIKKAAVLFQAQDLDAPLTATPGDLPGVQSRVVKLPHGTVFDNASVGISKDITADVGCTGAGFPQTETLAAYVSGACQPATTFEYVTASVAGGPATDLGALTTTEVISPNATDALIAPDNSLSTVNTGPSGTDPGASHTGSHFLVDLANAPVS